MSKKLTIGFIGSHVRMELIRNIIPEHFPELRCEIYENDRYDYCDDMAQDLLKLRTHIDGVVFGGELQYKLYQNLFNLSIPCTYIKKDSASLLNSLLSLSWQKADVSRVSVDNYTPSTVAILLSDAGIPENNIKILRRRTLGSVGEKYYDELYEAHRRLYRSGQVDGCVTTLIFVYDRLVADGIPAAYSRPTTDNIISTVLQLKTECKLHRNISDGTLAIMIVRLSSKEDVFYQPQSEYLDGHEKLKVAEELYYFAKNARATIIPQSDDHFTIVMNRDDLMNYSNGLECMPFLQLIEDNCNCDVSLGIGFGFTPGEARASANLATKMAAQHSGSCTYIVHNAHSITGPVNFVTPNITQQHEQQELLDNLAHKSGVSSAKLFRIYQLCERTKKSLFTVSELSDYLNLSVRGTNRMVNALEEHGLVEVSGHSANGKAGRPKNIYRVLFTLD